MSDPYAAAPIGTSERRVRVWFGRHAIADYTANAEAAGRFSDAMARRFAGLRITNEPIPPDLKPDAAQHLPGESDSGPFRPTKATPKIRSDGRRLRPFPCPAVGPFHSCNIEPLTALAERNAKYRRSNCQTNEGPITAR